MQQYLLHFPGFIVNLTAFKRQYRFTLSHQCFEVRKVGLHFRNALIDMLVVPGKDDGLFTLACYRLIFGLKCFLRYEPIDAQSYYTCKQNTQCCLVLVFHDSPYVAIQPFPNGMEAVTQYGL